MSAFRIYRRLRDLLDVDPNGLPHLGVPVLHTDVAGSSFVIETIAGGGGGGSFSLGASNLGNTLGLTGVTGSRVVLAGIGNVTLSESRDANGGTITISGGTVAAGAAFSAGVSGGNTAGDTGATGSRVVLAGGSNITLSQATDANGGTITVNAASQTEQTQHRFDLTVSGNTAGALAAVSSGTLTLAGGNNVTLSQAGNAITISAANQTAQPAQTGISSIAASDATYTSGQVQFTGSNMVTVRSSAGQRVVIDATQSVQSQNRFNLTLDGNTAGVLAEVSSGTLTVAGGNNITVSQNGNAITISGANAAGAQTAISGLANSQTTYTSGTVSLSELGAITIRSTTGNQFQFSVNPQSVQPETQTFIGGLSASDTLYTSGTVRLTGVGGGVTVSSNTGQRIDISVAAQSVQPETQTFVGGISASDTAYTSGTVRFTGVGGGVTVSSNTGQRVDISVAAPVAQTVQTQNLHNVTLSGNTAGAMAQISSGTMTLAGGNGITLSQAGNAITISGGADTQTAISGISASDTLYTSGTVRFTGVGGGITVSSNTGQRVDLSVAAPVAQTNQAGSLFAVGNTTSSSSGTYDARTLSLRGDGIISIAATNSGFRISASQSVQPGVQHLVVSNTTFSSGTVSLSGFGDITVNTAANIIRISAPAQTVQTQNVVDVTLSGNTAGAMALISSGTMTLAGGNGITLSQAGNAVTISGGADTQTAISGISASDTLYTSGTVRFTGVGGGITVSSNTGQRVDLSVAPPNPSFSAGVSNAGNTAGDTGVSGTRMVLAGLGAVTLSQATNANGNTVSISAPAQSAQTGISGIANSQTTYTSGTVSLSELGAITIRSTTGNQFQLSVNPQSVQPETQTFIGGISASDTLYTSGTVRLTGVGGGVTVSSNTGQRIDISVAAQSVQPETQTFVGGISASDTLYTSGSVRFTGVGGGITVSSNTGQRVDLSVAAPVAQTVQSLGMYALGNTTGQSSSTTFDARTVSLRGDGIISVGYSGGTLRISATQSVQPETQTFIAGVSASDTLYTSGNVRLTGVGGGITVSSNTGQRIDLSVAAQSVQPGIQNLIASDATFSSGTVSISGFGAATVNTAANIIRISVPVQTAQTGLSGLANSQTTYTSGTVSLSELGAITIRSTTGNQFQLSVNAQTGTQFSAGLSNIGNTAGDTVTVGGRLILAGGNNVTLSGSSNGVSQTITISAGGGAETQTAISGISASDTLYTSGTVRFTGVGGGVTVSSNTGQRVDISVAAQSVQPGVQHFVVSNTTFSSGTVSISGFGDVTVNTAANIIRISAPTQTAQTGLSGVAASNTTYTSGTFTITGVGGGITVSSNTGQRIDLSVAAQSVQTQNLHNVTLSGNTAGAMAQISSGTMTLAGGNNITLSQAGNAVTISAFNQTVESQSIGMSNLGNTSGTTGIASGGAVRFLFAGGNNITLSQSINGASGTITISAPNLGAGAMSAGVSNLGNTAGSTGVTGTRLVFVGNSNISLSQSTDANGGTISINGDDAFSAGMSTEGNTAGATGVTGTRMVLVGSGPISLSQTTGAAGGTVSVLGPATSLLSGVNGISISTNGSTVSIMQMTVSSLAPYDEAPMVTGQQGQATLHLAPVRIPNLQFDRIAVGLQVSNATNSSGSFTLSQWVGLYTQNANTLSLISSVSVSTNFSGSGTAGSYSRYGGPRHITIPWTMTLTGSDYWMGLNMRTTSGGADVSVSQLLVSKFTNVAWSGIMGTASNATDQRLLGLGVFTVSTAGMPASVAFSQINGTGSLALRAPVWHLRSGTV